VKVCRANKVLHPQGGKEKSSGVVSLLRRERGEEKRYKEPKLLYSRKAKKGKGAPKPEMGRRAHSLEKSWGKRMFNYKTGKMVLASWIT